MAKKPDKTPSAPLPDPVRNGINTNGHAPTNNNGTRFNEMLLNTIMSSRWGFLQKLMDPRRDIDQECGYPSTEEVGAEQYRLLFDRDPIASRVVKLFPLESWGIQPEVYESEDSENETEFEKAWDELPYGLYGANWHRSSEGNLIWEAMRRVDILSGIGHYGVLLLGIDDGKDLSEPIDGIDEKGLINNAELKKMVAKKGRRLLYLRCFDESLAVISKLEREEDNPRYGQPVEYQIKFTDPNISLATAGNIHIATRTVHWHRVVHIADNVMSSEVIGMPRMQPVLNRILDLRKLYGGSAEMYWKGAFPGLSIETHPQLGGDVSIDTEAMQNQMYDYQNSLQRYLALMGMSAKTLAPTVVDPTPQINTQIQAICIELGIPQRIFLGSERGELASSQDAAAWLDRLKDRQRMYLTPRVVVPFINRLIAIGCLPQPKTYTVRWPDLASMSEEEQARVAGLIIDVMVKYIQGGIENMMTPLDFMTRILHWEQDEAEGVIDAAMEAVEAEETLTMQPPNEEMGGPGLPMGETPPLSPDQQMEQKEAELELEAKYADKAEDKDAEKGSGKKPPFPPKGK